MKLPHGGPDIVWVDEHHAACSMMLKWKFNIDQRWQVGFHSSLPDPGAKVLDHRTTHFVVSSLLRAQPGKLGARTTQRWPIEALLTAGGQAHLRPGLGGPSSLRIDPPDIFNFIVEEIDSDRQSTPHRPQVDHISPRRKEARLRRPFSSEVSEVAQPPQKVLALQRVANGDRQHHALAGLLTRHPLHQRLGLDDHYSIQPSIEPVQYFQPRPRERWVRGKPIVWPDIIGRIVQNSTGLRVKKTNGTHQSLRHIWLIHHHEPLPFGRKLTEDMTERIATEPRPRDPLREKCTRPMR